MKSFSGMWISIRPKREIFRDFGTDVFSVGVIFSDFGFVGSSLSITNWGILFSLGSRMSHKEAANCLRIESPMKRTLLPDIFWKNVLVTWVRDKSPSSETKCFCWKCLTLSDKQQGNSFLCTKDPSLQVWLNFRPASHQYFPSLNLVTLNFREDCCCLGWGTTCGLGFWYVTSDMNKNRTKAQPQTISSLLACEQNMMNVGFCTGLLQFSEQTVLWRDSESSTICFSLKAQKLQVTPNCKTQSPAKRKTVVSYICCLIKLCFISLL